MINDVIEKMEKVSRTPRSYEAIEKGALALELKERVELRRILSKSIDEELAEMKQKLKDAESIVSGNSAA